MVSWRFCKYLCVTANPSTEVVQQSKARHKEDFLTAFSPFIADAASVAYKGASADIQGKLRRVVDVWRERNIFDREVLQDMDNRLAGEHPRQLPDMTLKTSFLADSFWQRLTGHAPQLTWAGLAATDLAPPRDLPSRFLQSSCL